ncbi:serine/threonine-protein kinase [Nocardia violaceofusca]|uniref:serine/threonine-protein kinase n=1 Tax=Nocardia violaceofusca TaxID=941182 RepID=UPI0007A44C73|nr:serine/threonine-protein kinase [Nocardia violaceofusca]
MTQELIKLGDTEWAIVRELGRGGFGVVYEVAADERRAAIKVVQKHPGADRELLATDLGDARNVVRVEEFGENETSYLLRMPLAKDNLRACLEARGAFPQEEVVNILRDIATALDDLGKVIVHRDVKPDNVLLIGDAWCLTDFGISRYAEAATAALTWKGSATYEYAPPEWWEQDHLEPRSDIYSTGVMAYEMLTGALPFIGPTPADFRHQHLTVTPAPIRGVDPGLAALVLSMLHKGIESRPSARRVLERLEKLSTVSNSPGALKIRRAGLEHTQRTAAATAARNAAELQKARRQKLNDAALTDLESIFTNLLTGLHDNAAEALQPSGDILHLRIGMGGTATSEPIAMLTLALEDEVDSVQRRSDMPFEVIATAYIELLLPGIRNHTWPGRRHSLWYCDAKHKGEFAWYETAFTKSVASPDYNSGFEPFSLPVDEESARALGSGTDIYCAWPFTEVAPHDMDEFSDRWMGWFGDALAGELHRPPQIERADARGSWRRD